MVRQIILSSSLKVVRSHIIERALVLLRSLQLLVSIFYVECFVILFGLECSAQHPVMA